MKVFVAGATGALGKQLVPALVAQGHDVVGMTRTPEKADLVRRLGAEPAVADGLDADAVGSAVGTAAPDVVVHQMTALSGEIDLRDMEGSFAQTTASGRREPTTCSRPLGRRERGGSSPRASPAGRRRGSAARSRPRTIRSIPTRRRRCGRSSTRSATWSGRDRGRGHRWPRASLRRLLRSRHVDLARPGRRAVEVVRERKFPIVGGGPASGRSSTWPTRRRRPSPRSSAASRASTTSSTTSRPASPSGCRPCKRRRGEAAATVPALAWQDRGRRGGDGDDDRDPRIIEREGEARARLAADVRDAGAMASRRGSPEVDEELYEELRPRAFAIAYRMLGTVTEAEDVVQEGLLRLHRTLDAGERLESPGAYLSTVVTRLAIDELRSARPVASAMSATGSRSRCSPAGGRARPSRRIADSLSLAFLVLLESLSPEQRAVLLLRDVFDYSFAEIAETIGKSEAGPASSPSAPGGRSTRVAPVLGVARGARRARDEVLRRRRAGRRRRPQGTARRRRRAAGRRRGQGAGVARAIHGRERAARTFGAWIRAGERIRGIRFSRVEVNGSAGRDHPRRRGQRDQRLRARDRRGPDPGHPLGRQPGQARAPRPGRGSGAVDAGRLTGAQISTGRSRSEPSQPSAAALTIPKKACSPSLSTWISMSCPSVADASWSVVSTPPNQELRYSADPRSSSELRNLGHTRRRRDVGDVLNPRPGRGEGPLDALRRQADRFDQLDRSVAAATEGGVVSELRRLTARADVLQRDVLDQEERAGAELVDEASHRRPDVLDDVGVVVRIAELGSKQVVRQGLSGSRAVDGADLIPAGS